MALAKKRKVLPLRERLIQQVSAYVAREPGCMTVMDVGNAMLVLVQRKFTTTSVINEASFQPHTKQTEVQIPVPVLLIFGPREVDRRMLTKFHALGGDSVLVKSLKDATTALQGG